MSPNFGDGLIRVIDNLEWCTIQVSKAFDDLRARVGRDQTKVLMLRYLFFFIDEKRDCLCHRILFLISTLISLRVVNLSVALMRLCPQTSTDSGGDHCRGASVCRVNGLLSSILRTVGKSWKKAFLVVLWKFDV